MRILSYQPHRNPTHQGYQMSFPDDIPLYHTRISTSYRNQHNFGAESTKLIKIPHLDNPRIDHGLIVIKGMSSSTVFTAGLARPRHARPHPPCEHVRRRRVRALRPGRDSGRRPFLFENDAQSLSLRDEGLRSVGIVDNG